jgi:antitoxin VapB
MLSTPAKPKEAKLFRNNRSQAVRIPVEFELPGERVLIHREGGRLIIEPVTRPTNIVELLTQWRLDAPFGQGDQFPDIDDMPAQPENLF